MNKVTYPLYCDMYTLAFNLLLKTGINNLKFTESGNIQTSPKPAFCNRFLTLDDQLITFILLSMV